MTRVVAGVDAGRGPAVRPEVAAAAGYQADWAGLDRAEYLLLDRNESTAPPSPSVLVALAGHLAGRGVHGYSDGENLPAAIAAYCGTTPQCVVPTNGSDQAIDLCLRAFLGPGSRMLVARPEFPIFSKTAAMIGAVVEGVPYLPDLGYPYREFTAAVAGRPDMIVFINPNNPTGTPVDPQYIVETAAAYPRTPVLVDEAYFEYTGVSVVDAVADHPNLIVLRTFSKAFAMAGLRLGYAVAAEPVCGQLAKLRNPFDVNVLAAVAGNAALAARDEMRIRVATVMGEVKPAVLAGFGRLGVPVVAGAANFMLVRPPDLDAAVAGLRTAGILVRPMGHPPLAGWFRMSLGSGDEMDRFLLEFQALPPVAAVSQQRRTK